MFQKKHKLDVEGLTDDKFCMLLEMANQMLPNQENDAGMDEMDELTDQTAKVGATPNCTHYRSTYIRSVRRS